jgi:hypothetical protein
MSKMSTPDPAEVAMLARMRQDMNEAQATMARVAAGLPAGNSTAAAWSAPAREAAIAAARDAMARDLRIREVEMAARQAADGVMRAAEMKGGARKTCRTRRFKKRRGRKMTRRR